MSKNPGSIVVICGSMFAGKSEELIRRARRAIYARRKLQVFKPAIDTRYSEAEVVTHMGVRLEAIAVESTADMKRQLDPKANTILIEEAQFFDEALVNWAQELADQGKEVILAGLDQDFRRQPFGPMAALLAIADEVIKLRAICVNCGNLASHTYRSINGGPAKWNDPLVLIGATESYEARCRNCYEIKGDPIKKAIRKKKP